MQYGVLVIGATAQRVNLALRGGYFSLIGEQIALRRGQSRHLLGQLDLFLHKLFARDVVAICQPLVARARVLGDGDSLTLLLDLPLDDLTFTTQGGDASTQVRQIVLLSASIARNLELQQSLALANLGADIGL